MNRIRRLLAAGVLDNTSYAQKLLKLLGNSTISIMPLDDVVGITARDIISSGISQYIGTVSYRGELGPSGNLVASFSDDAYLNCSYPKYTTGIDVAEGAFGVWLKATTPEQWIIGSGEMDIFRIFTNGNNRIALVIRQQEDAIGFYYTAGGTWTQWYTGWPFSGGTNWMHLLLSWSKSNDRVRLYLNGYLWVEVATLGTWSGTIASVSVVGTAASDNFPGLYDTAIFIRREPTAAEVKNIAYFAPRHNIKKLSALGDSITASTSWFLNLSRSRTFYPMNHAVASQSIIGNMDAQTVACASDDADIIIIALGTNDNNAGDMNALQAEYEENIAELKTSNPRASLYGMNVLPRWTDTGGGTPVDKGNIRTAIAAACTAQGITCWDTFTTPWITAAQTQDGLHPTAAGHAAIAAQVLARL